MGSTQQYSLRWNNYLNHITDAFGSLRTGEDLVDVTLSCEGKKIRGHKMLLSACSPYFRELFKENPCQHPIIIFRNVKFEDLVAIIDFMYQGEVNVAQEQLSSFLATAELLAIKGLADSSCGERIACKESEETVSSPDPFDIKDELEIITDKHLVSNSQSFAHNSKKPASPQRKRKHSVPSRPSNNFIEKKQCTTLSSNSVQNDDDEVIEVHEPIIPKIEKQELFDDSYESISDQSRTIVNPLQTILRNCDPCTESSALEYNNINSSSLLHDVTSGEISDIEQVLMEPGTSNEILSQDSLQAENIDGIPGLSSKQTEENKRVDSSGKVITIEEKQIEDDNYPCDLCRQEKLTKKKM